MVWELMLHGVRVDIVVELPLTPEDDLKPLELHVDGELVGHS